MIYEVQTNQGGLFQFEYSHRNGEMDVKIVKLSLDNFRNARKIVFDDDLSLDSRMNVFYGINGAGKSTILDAIAILLSWLAARMKSPNGSGRSIDVDDINNEAFSASIGLAAIHLRQDPFSWSMVKNRPGRQNAEAKSNFSGANELSKSLIENANPFYPVLAFYPVTRAVIDIPLRIRNKHDFGPLNAYENSLSSAADFRTFFEWFREREDIENEQLRDSGNLIKDSQLEAVRNALEKILPGFTKLTVKRSPLHMEVTKEGRTLMVNQLSDGEKCLLALVGDLARRLAIANKQKKINALNGEGIVLIDEIDLHLHPEWQRMVVPRLLDTFPQCQFFISTHSPLVLNQLQPENLFMLRNNETGLVISRPDASYGKSSNRVLEDLMSLPTTHTDDVASELKTIFHQIAEGKIPEAENGIAELRRKGFNDPELRKAETLIRRKELIGK